MYLYEISMSAYLVLNLRLLHGNVSKGAQDRLHVNGYRIAGNTERCGSESWDGTSPTTVIETSPVVSGYSLGHTSGVYAKLSIYIQCMNPSGHLHDHAQFGSRVDGMRDTLVRNLLPLTGKVSLSVP